MKSTQDIPNILIVDDIGANLKLLVDILKIEGYKTRPVPNGSLALLAAEKEKPDLILLDIIMPGIDGFEVCRRLKENPGLRDIPVIFISALDDTGSIVKALAAGGVDYINKPFRAEEVKARVQTHLKLHRQSKELNELNEFLEERVAERTHEIEQFTFITAHDLQEPLLAITNFTQLLQAEFAGKLEGDGQKYVEFIAGSAGRMKSLVKGLLDFFNLGKDSVKSMVDCNIMVSEVIADLDDLINRNHAKITMEKLPIIYGSETELKLLFWNLIVNAIKFRKKDILPEIKIMAESFEKKWLFRISDNGIGIEEKNREKIFIIFKRMHDRGDYEGTGVGLSHCKKIVELHGGKIWVESSPGAGSIFIFTISKA
jgi:two-component system, sensor histidine kinase and response regulator